MKKMQIKFIKQAFYCVVLFSMLATSLFSAPTSNTFKTPQQEKLYNQLITELRCPKCQNQNLDGSSSAISVSLKMKIASMVQQNYSKQEIIDFMVARYGNHISYNPPIKPITYVLWFLPPLFFLMMFGALFWMLKKQNKKLEEIEK